MASVRNYLEPLTKKVNVNIKEVNIKMPSKQTMLYVGVGCGVGLTAGAAVLPLVGFGAKGVAAGSMAAGWQSSIGCVAAGSTFASVQSFAATGGAVTLGYAGAVTGAAVGAMTKLKKCAF